MKISNELEVIIQIIKAALNQQSFELEKKEVSWDQIEEIINAHHIQCIAYCGLILMENIDVVPQAFMNRLRSSFDYQIVKEAHQQFCLEEISESFENNHIAFIPLKGSVLKNLYPSPQMRSMSDLDILHNKSQKKEVFECLSELGYQLIHDFDEKHDIYQKNAYIRVEMHKSLLESPKNQKEYFDHIWERVTLKENKKYEYEMTREDYYLFMLAHMAKHFRIKGTGLRSLIDFYVFQKNEGKHLNREIVDQVLIELNLDKFEKMLFELQECVFNHKEWNDEVLLDTFNYFVLSGVHGTYKNLTMNTVVNEKTKIFGKIKLIIHALFPYREKMEMLYPWLKNKPYFIGIMYIHRGFKCLFFKKDHLKDFVFAVNSKQENLSSLQEIFEKSGLK